MPWAKDKPIEEIRAYARMNMARYRAKNPSYKKKERKSDKERRHKLKLEVLSHYSSPRDHIIMCVDPYRKHWYADPFLYDIRVLSLDKIDGNHTKSGLPYGDTLYKSLKKQGYPKGWQVLCMNCQWAKRYENKEITL